MDANETVAVYTTNFQLQADILKNALEQEGIKCQVDSEGQGGLVGLTQIRLLVHAADAERARQILEEHESRPGEEEEET